MKTITMILLLSSVSAYARNDYNVFACTKAAKLTFARSKGINPIPVMSIYGKDTADRTLKCETMAKALTTYFNALSSSTLLTMKSYCDHRPGHDVEAFRLFIKGSPYWNGRDIMKFKLTPANNQICQDYSDRFDDFLSEHIR